MRDDKRRHDDTARAQRRRLALRVAILFWRYKGGFYTHISTFSILNSAYTHIQAFIFMRRRRGLAIRVTVLFWHYERFGFLRIYHLFHTKQHIYFQGASGYNQGVVKGNSLSKITTRRFTNRDLERGWRGMF